MAKQKVKTFSFQDQQQFCEDKLGVPVKQTTEVFNAFVESTKMFIKENIVDKNVENAVLMTPLVGYGVHLQPEEERIDKDGKKYMTVEHYTTTVAVPQFFINALNVGRNLTKVPLEESKAIA